MECLVLYPGSSEKSRWLVEAIRRQLESLIEFEKRCRLFVSTDDESLSVVAVHSNIAFDFVELKLDAVLHNG
jgi:hypothetical protein